MCPVEPRSCYRPRACPADLGSGWRRTKSLHWRWKGRSGRPSRGGLPASVRDVTCVRTRRCRTSAGWVPMLPGREPGVEPVEVGYAVVGLAALLAGLLPRLLERRAFSMPLSFLLLGI